MFLWFRRSATSASRTNMARARLSAATLGSISFKGHLLFCFFFFHQPDLAHAAPAQQAHLAVALYSAPPPPLGFGLCSTHGLAHQEFEHLHRMQQAFRANLVACSHRRKGCAAYGACRARGLARGVWLLQLPAPDASFLLRAAHARALLPAPAAFRLCAPLPFVPARRCSRAARSFASLSLAARFAALRSASFLFSSASPGLLSGPAAPL